MHLIYPADLVRSDLVDIRYELEATSFAQVGASISVYCEASKTTKEIVKGRLETPYVFYRGWALGYEAYQSMQQALAEQGVMLSVSPKMYLRSQWINGWYSSLEDLTFETILVTKKELKQDALQCLSRIPWFKGSFYVRDFEKDNRAPFASASDDSIVSGKESAKRLLYSMVKDWKGFRGGIAFRKTLDVNQYDCRQFFVLDKEIVSLDSEQGVGIPSVVHEVAKRHQALFYVVETVKTNEGETVVLQVGDGQVADFEPVSSRKFAEGIVQAAKRGVARWSRPKSHAR